MRIAVIHEWLSVYAGAERVLEQMENQSLSFSAYCYEAFSTHSSQYGVGNILFVEKGKGI
jgi:hypothetical protein